MTKWSHRSFGIKSDVDKQVLRNGEPVARIYRRAHGPSEGKWAYFPQWIPAPPAGDADSLAEALEIIRNLYETYNDVG